MTIKVIDISSHQSVEAAADSNADGVIVKTTQGTYYTNPKGDAQYQMAKQHKKLLGVYHYAGGGDPKAEAAYFVQHSKGYIGEATLWLDWESGENPAWGNTNWAATFIDEVHKLTGVYPGIYVQASALAQVANVANRSALWIAGYPSSSATWAVPTFPYSTAPWSTYTLWQFTDGGGLDKNIGNIDAAGWKKLANPGGAWTEPDPKPEVKPPTYNGKYSTANKSLETMAAETQSGKTGSGDTRKSNLGKYYTGVQAIVNERTKTISSADCHAILKKETLNGVYGNGDERKRLLGTYYQTIQNGINSSSKPAARTYTVKSGDTLSGIGLQLGVAWTSIASMNGLKDPYIIQPGQVLKY